jgi:hypothetical protein
VKSFYSAWGRGRLQFNLIYKLCRWNSTLHNRTKTNVHNEVQYMTTTGRPQQRIANYCGLEHLLINLVEDFTVTCVLYFSKSTNSSSQFTLFTIVRVMDSRGVQIRSEFDRIRADFGTKIFMSDWIALIKLFRSRIGLRYSTEIKWVNYPRQRGCRFNWTSLCQLLDMYFLLLYLFG